MSKPDGFFILIGDKRETIGYHCSRCSADYIIGEGSPARVFCCGQWKEHKPEQPTGLLGFFSGPAPLPRVRFKEMPVRRLIQRDESEGAGTNMSGKPTNQELKLIS